MIIGEVLYSIGNLKFIQFTLCTNQTNRKRNHASSLKSVTLWLVWTVSNLTSLFFFAFGFLPRDSRWSWLFFILLPLPSASLAKGNCSEWFSGLRHSTRRDLYSLGRAWVNSALLYTNAGPFYLNQKLPIQTELFLFFAFAGWERRKRKKRKSYRRAPVTTNGIFSWNQLVWSEVSIGSVQ